jgi:putative protease
MREQLDPTSSHTVPALDPYAVVPEILAPAGGRQQFFAALNSGADAVFLGLESFNARARATNFTAADLKELVPVAHAFGMKVLVTVNILIKQLELTELFRTLDAIEASCADAIIVQDLAVARIAKKYFPAIRLHASTQMAVHNITGVLEAAKYGFKRVVLARELTHQEVRKIRAAVPRDVAELEAFCHGSLCYSYSGLCFFSGAEDARSGNRGECAYTCRQPYKIINEPGHGFLFSMKDLDTSKNLDLLIKAGIDTLKIEGRKKDAQYVATSVKLYRQNLNRLFGRDTLRKSAPASAFDFIHDNKPVENDLEFAFKRQPTSFFLKSRYQENVIDLDNPTHKGLDVGSIISVSNGQITFRTHHAIELYDGLRIVDTGKVFHSKPQDGTNVRTELTQSIDRYENKHSEFSVRSIYES